MDMLRYAQIPYKPLGRDFSGCDCYGLLVLYFKNERGVALRDYNTETTECATTAIEESHNDWFKVRIEDVVPGDILLVLDAAKVPTHCGIVVNKRQFIHITEAHGCIASRMTTWQSLVVGAYRYKGAKK